MKHYIRKNKRTAIIVLLFVAGLTAAFFVINATAQCDPDDLTCISMP